MYLYSNPEYSKKYINFILTPPIKRGQCFGLCITWLSKCLASEIENKDAEKYLRMNINDDFFRESCSVQHFNTSLSAFTRFESPTCTSALRDSKFDFLRRMESTNRVRQQNNLRYELEFSLFNTAGKEVLTKDFFAGVITSSLFGIVIGLVSQDKTNPSLHAISLLQIKGERYLFDPNLGVFNITSCKSVPSALVNLAFMYIRSPELDEKYYRIDPHSEAIGVIPRFIN